MKASTRNSIYIALGILNAALIAAQQQNAIPAHYSQYALGASFVLAAAMKAFGSKDPPPPDPPAAPMGFRQ